MRKGRCPEAESIHKLIRTEIIKSNTSSFENISSRSCAKEMWTKVRELTGKGRVSQSQAGIQGLNISAEQLNLHYAKISTDINYEHSSLKSSVCCSDSCSLISDYSVFKYLDSLKPTASGPDQIPYWFLKIGAPSLYIPLTYLYNLSLTLGIVPLQWKTATIKPIPKIPSPQTCSDFRPISLTTIVSRVLEKLVV